MFATLAYALCDANSSQQRGFVASGGIIQKDGSCVTFLPNGGYNSPLSLSSCDNSTQQSWVYDPVSQSFRNPPSRCGGLNGACIEWSGQEHGNCTTNPPSLGPGCIVGSWPSPSSTSTTSWNDMFLLDSPVSGMIEAVSTTGLAGSGLCVEAVPPPPLPVPTEDVLVWSQKELMCLYDIDMCTYSPSELQGCDCSRPPPPVNTWAPSNLDTDSWIAAGMSAGCQIHILVAKHMCGFVSWNSTAGSEIGYNYSSLYSSTPVDVVAPFVASARKASQSVGMYYSLTNNARTKTCSGNILPNPSPGQISVTPVEYDSLVRAHLTELWSNYGPLAEVWFDGGFTPSQLTWIPTLLASLQPHAVAFNGETLSPNPSRWIGTESGYAPNETWSTCDYSDNGRGGGSPNSQQWFPAETDFTVLQGDTWFFDTLHAVRSPMELRAMYEASVGHNTQALIGIGIPPNGTLTGTAQATSLATLGAWIRGCYGSPIAQTSGSGTAFTVMPSAAVAIDRVVMSEDQTTGQRVRAWTLSAYLTNGSNVTLGQGLSIGNKRVVAFPEVQGVTMVLLNILQAVGTPVLRSVAIFGGCNALAAALDATSS